MMNFEDFNYIEHYSVDAEEFDYFQERAGATKHDERRVREFVISFVDKNVKNILDVGCGSAWVAKNFLPTGIKVCSLDISIKNSLKAVRKYQNKNHSGIVSDSFKLPFKNNSFDLVIATEIIEHVVKPDEFVKELFRLVKRGRKLIITTPYKEAIRYNLCIHCNKATPVNAHLHSFDEKKLEKLYKGNDLKSFEKKVFGNKLLIFLRTYTILQFFSFRLWKLIDKLANLIFYKPIHIIAIYRKTK